MNDDWLLVVSPAYPPPFVGGSKVWTFNMVENSGYTNYEILTSKLKDDCEEVINPNYKIHRSKYLWDSNTSNPSRRELFVSYSYMNASSSSWVFSNLRSLNTYFKS